MHHYKHVLFASDLTPESEKVGEQAKWIAELAHAELSIVHVIEPAPVIYGGGEFAIPLDAGLEQTLQTETQKKMTEQAVRLNIPFSQQYIITGATKASILELVNKLKIDLLVVGGASQHGLALLLGSTANALLHAMPCDILTVKVEP